MVGRFVAKERELVFCFRSFGIIDFMFYEWVVWRWFWAVGEIGF